MATNTLGAYNPIFYANEALIYLTNALGLGTRVHLGYDKERKSAEKGQTITIRRPSVFTAQSAPSTSQNVATSSVDINLSSWQEVKFDLPDNEHAYTGEQLVKEHIGPAAYALANKIDQDLAALAITVPHVYSEATGTAATIAGITGTQRKLFDLKCPVHDTANMHFMIGGKEKNDLLNITNFATWSGVGNVGAQTAITSDIGQRYGFNFWANQNRTSATYADVTDFAGATTATVAKGATSMAVGSLGTSEVYKKGTIIKMTSGTDLGSEYALTADATMTAGAATVTINPPARNAMGSGDTFSICVTQGEATPNQDVTVATTTSINLAFHRNWAALAFAPLPMFENYSNKLGADIHTVQDPVTGISLRARIFYMGDSSKMVCALDALYGVKELDSELACRYEVKTS